MNYSDLTKTQKRCIDAFIKLRPELASVPTISRPEVEALFAELFALRATGGEKIGYPMWLVKGTSVTRGHYVFPAPNLAEEETIVTQAVSTSDEDKQFFEELAEHGLLEVA